MTKQEAAMILKCIKAENMNIDYLYIKDRYDALNMAIKSLEQEFKAESET